MSMHDVPRDKIAAADDEADALLDDHLPNRHAFGAQSDAVASGGLGDLSAGESTSAGQHTPQQETASDTAKSIADATKERMSSTGNAMQEKADQGMDKAAEALNRTAETVREQGEQHGGTVASVATKAADTMETTSAYLRDKNTDQLVADLEALVRRKPVESLLVAAGVGLVLSKLLR